MDPALGEALKIVLSNGITGALLVYFIHLYIQAQDKRVEDVKGHVDDLKEITEPIKTIQGTQEKMNESLNTLHSTITQLLSDQLKNGKSN